MPLDDLVVSHFEITPRSRQIAVEGRVKLLYHTDGEANLWVGLVDQLQGVPIAGDLLLRSGTGNG